MTTSYGHCRLKLVIPVITPQQGLNPALSFSPPDPPLKEMKKCGWELYGKPKTPMLAAAKKHNILVFDVKYIL